MKKNFIFYFFYKKTHRHKPKQMDIPTTCSKCRKFYGSAETGGLCSLCADPAVVTELPEWMANVHKVKFKYTGKIIRKATEIALVKHQLTVNGFHTSDAVTAALQFMCGNNEFKHRLFIYADLADTLLNMIYQDKTAHHFFIHIIGCSCLDVWNSKFNHSLWHCYYNRYGNDRQITPAFLTYVWDMRESCFRLFMKVGDYELRDTEGTNLDFDEDEYDSLICGQWKEIS